MPEQPALQRMLALCCLALALTGYALSCVTSPTVQLSEQQRIDNAIAEIVLTDMTTRDADLMGFSFTDQAPRDVYFAAVPPEHVWEVLRPLVSEETGEIDVPQQGGILQAAKNLESRHAAGAGLTSYHPRNRRLQRGEPAKHSAPTVNSPWQMKFNRWYQEFMMSEHGSRIYLWTYWLTEPFSEDYQAGVPVEVTAPGYSDDGELAIVWVFCPEFLHHSVGTYVLERSGKTWRIVRVEFLLF